MKTYLSPLYTTLGMFAWLVIDRFIITKLVTTIV